MKKSENILLLGLGSIGYYLAKRLSQEGHQVTAIEHETSVIQKAQEELDVRIIKGDATDFREWIKADAYNMDYMMAMTNDDSVNIVAAMLADRFGIAQKIIRDRSIDLWSSDAVLKSEDFGINHLIQPEELAAQEIVRLLKMRAGNVLVGVGDGELQLIAIHVQRRSPFSQMLIRDLAEKIDHFPFQVVSVSRDIQTIIPTGNFKILPGDHIFVLVHKEDLPALIEFSGITVQEGRRVMIIGGGMVGSRLAELLQNDYRVRLIEKNEDRAEELSFYLKQTECLHGDGADKETLLQAGLLQMDTIIATTSDNDTNIMTSVLAKHLLNANREGDACEMEKTIALVKREEYAMLAAALGTNFAVNKKQLAANAVLRYMRRGHVISVCHLQGSETEVVEMYADPTSKIVGKRLSEMRGLDERNIRIGAILKNNHWKVADGSMKIEVGDRAVCICKEDSLGYLQELFLA